MFKQKTWTEVNRFYTPAVQNLESISGTKTDTMRKVLHGFTTIELRCDQTGELKFYEEYGDLT